MRNPITALRRTRIMPVTEARILKTFLDEWLPTLTKPPSHEDATKAFLDYMVCNGAMERRVSSSGVWEYRRVVGVRDDDRRWTANAERRIRRAIAPVLK